METKKTSDVSVAFWFGVLTGMVLLASIIAGLLFLTGG
jgi:hypothetical protein